MSEPLKIAVAGLGTVGLGTIKILRHNADLLERRCGRELVLTAVSARDPGKDRGLSLDNLRWYDDAVHMATDSQVDVVVELIGGSDGIARRLCEAAIAAGKHVVTANKALIADHGTALAEAADSAGVTLAFEAAVAGGIPIVKTLREGLAANRLSRVYGILNGTCNYILTSMHENGCEFSAALEKAQQLGYAEADPRFDVEGIDSAHKLAILSSLAFGCDADFKAVYVEGIRHISLIDIRFAEELGYRIKLLGIASLKEAGMEQRVHPCMVPSSLPIANVDGVYNAVVSEGDFVGSVIQEGMGAGALPTASAVVADIVDIGRGNRVPAFAVPAAGLRKLPTTPMEDHCGAYYIRLMVVDRPGVFAEVASVLRKNKVSMEAVLQRGRAPGEAVPVVMSLHETRERDVNAALIEIGQLDSVVETPRKIRIELF